MDPRPYIYYRRPFACQTTVNLRVRPGDVCSHSIHSDWQFRTKAARKALRGRSYYLCYHKSLINTYCCDANIRTLRTAIDDARTHAPEIQARARKEQSV